MNSDEVLVELCEEILDKNIERRVANAIKWGMEAQKSLDMHRLKLSAGNIFYCGESFGGAEERQKKEDIGWGA
jgi:hypothetical protein